METTPTTSKPKPSWKERINQLTTTYGPVALVVYFGIFFLVWGAFAVAIRYFGFQPQGVAGEAGVWTMAYLATKLTQPARIAATFALTPLMAKVVGRRTPPAA
ncbi:MAG: FAM210 family protein, partial [Myxococcaceae bacterium]|nr:FAM210 family protein [Myxococcaceae bacterium]MCI0669854.1 FAM210 family protein [Myxococcaceae bacterium]